MINDEQTTKLIEGFQRARGNRATFREEAEIVLEWAGRVAMEYAILENVLAGVMSVDVIAGDVFFSLTQDGIEYVEQNLIHEKLKAGDKQDNDEKLNSLEERVLRLLAVAANSRELTFDDMGKIVHSSASAVGFAIESLRKRGFVDFGKEPNA